MEMPAQLVNRCSPHISQKLHLIIHILHFCFIDSLLNYVADFV